MHNDPSQPPPFDEILRRHPDFFEQAVTPKEAAVIIDSTPAALAQMRTRGTGPPYHRLPTITVIDKRHRPRGPIRYTRRDLIEWLRRQRRYSNTAEEVVSASPGRTKKRGRQTRAEQPSQ